jgi:hypothetical protein
MKDPDLYILNLGEDAGFSPRLFGLIFPIGLLKEGQGYLFQRRKFGSTLLGINPYLHLS